MTQGIPQAQLVPEVWSKPSAVDQQSQDIHNQLPTQSSPASLRSLGHQILPVVPEEREGHDQSPCLAEECHSHPHGMSIVEAQLQTLVDVGDGDINSSFEA